jgi:hypothetical protein
VSDGQRTDTVPDWFTVGTELDHVRKALSDVLTWAAKQEPPLSSPRLDDAQDILNRQDEMWGPL